MANVELHRLGPGQMSALSIQYDPERSSPVVTTSLSGVFPGRAETNGFLSDAADMIEIQH